MKKIGVNTRGQIVHQDGTPLSRQELANMQGVSFGGNRSSALQSTEKPYGERDTVRAETPDVAGALLNLSIELRNTSTTAQKIVIFDGQGMLGDQIGLPTQNGVVTVQGNFGVNTLAQLKSLALGSAVDLHSYHMQGYVLSGGTPGNTGTGAPGTGQTETASDKIFLGNNFQLGKSDIAGVSPQVKQFTLSKMTDGGTFDTTIRQSSKWRFIGGGFTGIIINLPALTGLVMNFDIAAYSNTKLMDVV
jgi:hypothetical protein